MLSFAIYASCGKLCLMSIIYLDNAATTPLLEETAGLLAKYQSSLWYNPSALYGPALEVRREMEASREALCAAFGSPDHACVFTSGGTEAANMVIRHGTKKYRGANYVCAGFEHPCVEESFKALSEAGEDVRFTRVRSDGSTAAEDLLQKVDASTALVSVMHVNNETGAVNDVESLAYAVKKKAPKAVFHVDGVQAFLRVPLQNARHIDYYTVSAHKVHGLKGTGAVFYGRHTPLKAMLRGGGQENSLRSGTENVAGILSFGAAAQYFAEHRNRIDAVLREVREVFLDTLGSAPGFTLLSPQDTGAPHILSFLVDGLRGETLVHALEPDEVYISMGSACSSRKDRSRAARQLALSQEQASGMIRISTSPFTTPEDARKAGTLIRKRTADLRVFRV